MGATLRYAKVVDRDHLQARGGLSPGVDSVVLLSAAPPSTARDFLVLRAWDDIGSALEEHWRIEDRNGHVVYVGTPRTVLTEHGDIADDVAGVRFGYADDGYQLVLEVDGREVARADFTVAEPGDPAVPSTPASPSETTPSTPDAAAGEESTAPPSQARDQDEPVVRDLSDTEQRVLDAVAQVETTGTPGFAHDVAAQADLDVATARRALSGLTGDHDLVQEVSSGTGDDPDLGPRYRIKARP